MTGLRAGRRRWLPEGVLVSSCVSGRISLACLREYAFSVLYVFANVHGGLMSCTMFQKCVLVAKMIASAVDFRARF